MLFIQRSSVKALRPRRAVQTSMKKLFIIFSVALLAGCSTPQERAVQNYCQAQAFEKIPKNLVNQQVYRSVRVGERVTGHRNSCRTEIKNRQDGKGGAIKSSETVCMDEPITQPEYQNQLVTEVVDLNQSTRQNYVRECAVDALSKNMFSHLR